MTGAPPPTDTIANALDADTTLCDVALALDYLLAVTPVDVPEAWKAFRASGYRTPPCSGTAPSPPSLKRIDLSELDVVMLRNDPADDFLDRPWRQSAGIVFGQLAAARGTLVVNDPIGLSQALNKLYLHAFPREVRPETLVTRDPEEVRTFAEAHGGKAIVKPLQGSGGQNVFLIERGDAPNLNQMIEAVARDGYVVTQEYLPAAAKGDVRLFMMNGRPLESKGTFAAFARERSGTDLRSNMRVGATAAPAHATDCDAPHRRGGTAQAGTRRNVSRRARHRRGQTYGDQCFQPGGSRQREEAPTGGLCIRDR